MDDKNKKKRNRRYDDEFKKNALQLIENGRSVADVSESLGVATSLLYSWKKKEKAAKYPSVQQEQAEIKKLRQELKRVEEERDILKKALGIFSREI